MGSIFTSYHDVHSAHCVERPKTACDDIRYDGNNWVTLGSPTHMFELSSRHPLLS
ncbi:hypothetical protein SERLADRAFT_391634 [Serpula lacrymans var. lacrymans S7.9]|uniref:Uncharacterized protein n=1 Tax=Serpula lacrymans var. lacrymans (strain S7.9) TaxID=578457 RepID=F8P0J0_SERL9|nr:uncharacterized protein SERLADRAFT_391634 [Serpula lacrymans var. lacrymans S7.9]EGO23545.1 hypothetical protein SERLADRAFT_391634 [Serpula lacrymans var. lacrymans S7.9]